MRCIQYHDKQKWNMKSVDKTMQNHTGSVGPRNRPASTSDLWTRVQRCTWTLACPSSHRIRRTWGTAGWPGRRFGPVCWQRAPLLRPPPSRRWPSSGRVGRPWDREGLESVLLEGNIDFFYANPLFPRFHRRRFLRGCSEGVSVEKMRKLITKNRLDQRSRHFRDSVY